MQVFLIIVSAVEFIVRKFPCAVHMTTEHKTFASLTEIA